LYDKNTTPGKNLRFFVSYRKTAIKLEKSSVAGLSAGKSTTPRWDKMGAKREKKKNPESLYFSGFLAMSHSGLEPETT